jgi:glycosyltransferase involved in cell wall biosynthesis
LYQHRVALKIQKKFPKNAIYWFPFNTGLHFRMKGIKPVVTIHDLLVYQYPKFVKLPNRIYRHWALRRAVLLSEAIICVSKTIQYEVYMRFNKLIRDKPITTIYEGCLSIAESNYREHPILSQNQPFLLFVGVGRKNKNLLFLCKCYNKLVKSKKYGGHLYIAGKIPGGLKESLKAYLQTEGIQKKVKFLGHVASEELPLLYKKCDAFVFPSIYEGFGLPIVEASYYGARVVTSNGGACAEVGDGFAFLANPFDSEEFSKTIIQAIYSRAIKRVDIDKYSWDRAARRMMGFFESLIK